MPVSVLMPHQRPEPREKQEVDPMDKILKGLNIASSIFGLKESYDKGQMLKEDRELNKLKISQAAKEKEMEGITLLPKDLLSHGDKYSVADTSTPGAMKFMLKERGGNMKEIYLTPKQKEVDPLAQATKALVYQNLKNKISEEKNLPQNVSQAATFGKRVSQANEDLESLINKGFDPTSVGSRVQQSEYFPEGWMSQDSKSYRQSRDNFINALLRRESGSAIAPSEYQSADRQYFPVQGDGPEVLAQKLRNRQTVIAGLLAEGSKALPGLERQLQIQGSPSQEKTSQITREQAAQELIRRQGLRSAVGRK